MQLMTLADIKPDEARQKFLEYKRAVAGRHDEEMAQIMRGYREIARGRQVIDIVATIQAGGTTPVPAWERASWRSDAPMVETPRLAIMRSDEPWCWVTVRSGGGVRFDAVQRPAPNARRNVVRLPSGTVPEPASARWAFARAMVPPVPPSLRPTIALGNFHTLFEAEWEPVAPKDPALLRHIGGDLYAVLATWDLTELERTVLAGRFRS